MVNDIQILQKTDLPNCSRQLALYATHSVFQRQVADAAQLN